MNFHCSGLKCDAKECDYIDMSIKFEDYPKYINAPCPKCGAPLLTQADYDTVSALHNLFSNPIMNALEKMIGDKKGTSLKISLDGSGKPKFEPIQEKSDDSQADQ